MRPIQPSHVRGCVLYFFLFTSFGCVSPFMPLIWSSKGLSEHQVGVIGAIRPIVSFFITPFLCAFADRHSIQQKMLYVSLILYSVTLPCVLIAGGFITVALVEASCSVSKSPVGSLVDSAVRRSFGGDGYGTQRLWGAVGFGVASLIGGYVCDSTGGRYGGVMIVFVASLAVTLVASTGVPIGVDGHRDDEKDDASEVLTTRYSNGSGRDNVDYDDQSLPPEIELGEVFSGGGESTSSHQTSSTSTPTDLDGDVSDGELNVRVEQSKDDDDELARLKGDVEQARGTEDETGVLSTVWIMLGNFESASIFAAVGLSGMGFGVIDTFLFIRLEELGGSHLLCGLARLIMCIAEVPFFCLSGPMIRRIGVRGVIAWAQLAYLVRFIYYAVLEDPWWVLPAEVLHGLTYAAMWAATTDYAFQIAPARLRTTIQGVVSGLHRGFGFGLGAVIGGILYAGLGARLCFGVSAVLPSLSLVLLALPTARSYFSRCGSIRAIGVGEGDRNVSRGSYELVDKGTHGGDRT